MARTLDHNDYLVDTSTFAEGVDRADYTAPLGVVIGEVYLEDELLDLTDPSFVEEETQDKLAEEDRLLRVADSVVDITDLPTTGVKQILRNNRFKKELLDDADEITVIDFIQDGSTFLATVKEQTPRTRQIKFQANDAMELMIEKYRPFINARAATLCGGNPGLAEDLRMAGIRGLSNGISMFSAAKAEDKAGPYLQLRIRGEMIDVIRQDGRVGRRQLGKVVVDSLEYPSGDGEGATLLDTLATTADEEAAPGEVQEEKLAKLLQQALDTLRAVPPDEYRSPNKDVRVFLFARGLTRFMTAEERSFFEAHCENGATKILQKDIGKLLFDIPVTNTRVSQIAARITKELRPLLETQQDEILEMIG